MYMWNEKEGAGKEKIQIGMFVIDDSPRIRDTKALESYFGRVAYGRG